MQLLPESIPTPVLHLPWEQQGQLEFQDVQSQLHYAFWLFSDPFGGLSEAARGGCRREDFEWAMAVRVRVSCPLSPGYSAATSAGCQTTSAGWSPPLYCCWYSYAPLSWAPARALTCSVCPAPCSTDACPCPLQVVHSRTFGTGAPEGGVGVRMLLPVMDLLNHAGDEADFTLSDTVRRADNVRWAASHATANLVRLVWMHGGKAAWVMQSSASTQPALV